MNDTKIKKQKERSRYCSVSEASLITGICTQTLRILADEQKVTSYKTPGGQRKFDKEYLLQMCSPSPVIKEHSEGNSSRQDFIYARVSSKKQLDDLSRQVEYIKSSRNGEFSSFTIVQDIGSGINFKRKGFNSILESCLQGTIGKVVIAHRDRLCRFGFELVESIITKCGGSLFIIDDDKHKSTEQELSEDLLSIVHIYSCRQMGKRKYRHKDNEMSSVANLSN